MGHRQLGIWAAAPGQVGGRPGEVCARADAGSHPRIAICSVAAVARAAREAIAQRAPSAVRTGCPKNGMRHRLYRGSRAIRLKAQR